MDFKCPHGFLPGERVDVTMTTTFKRLCICRATRKVVVFERDIRCKIILARQQLPVKYITLISIILHGNMSSLPL